CAREAIYAYNRFDVW
nr:immunoglobulin heavy chain junction region [Macaca mulatta]